MTQLILKEWNGRTIRVREDRYVCLTDMAQACGKEFKHWNENKKTESYLATLSRSVGMSTDQLIEIKTDGLNEERGTYGHPKVALRFAQWCSDDFAVQVDIWLDELLTKGTVSIVSKSPAQLLLMYAQQLVDVEEEQKRLAAVQVQQQVQLEAATTALTETRQEVTALKAAMLALHNTVEGYRAGTLTQTPRNILNELVQKLGAILSLKEGTSVGDAIRRVWADISLRLRNSSIHFDLEARHANAKRTYEQELAQWKAGGSLRGQKPQEPTRPTLLETNGHLTEAIEACIGLAQGV